jgi:hypothetical protein
VLVFIPHLGYASWFVLAATIIIIVCSLVTCGMRRTLVSRRAHRKRIQENAEMSGENYFARKAVQEAVLPRAESPPPLSGSVSPHTEKMMGYSSFAARPNPAMDDRAPLNPSTLSFRTAPSVRSDRGGYGNGRAGGIGRRPSRDQFGNPIPNDPYMGPDSDLVPPPLRPKGSSGSLGSQGSGRSMGPPGLYPRGRNGRGPSRGGYPPRGGPMRGGPGMRGPPPGWNGDRGRGGMMAGRGGPMMGRPGGSPIYDENVTYGQAADGRYRSPGPFNGQARSASPSPPLPAANGSPVDNQVNYRAISPPSNLDRRSPGDLQLSDQ